MHRYEELEKIYYRKLFLKYFLTFIVLGGVVGGGYYLYKNPQYLKLLEIKEDKKVVNDKKVANKVEISKSNSNKVEVNKTKEVEAIEFVVPKEALNKKLPNPTTKKIVKPAQRVVTQSEKPPAISETRIREKRVSILSLERRFKESKSYDLAIILAKRYLRMNNLKKAQYWALRANELDPQKPDSWIVFAKILAKQGKKDKAIQVLNTYIDSYGENEAVNDMLNELKEGE